MEHAAARDVSSMLMRAEEFISHVAFFRIVYSHAASIVFFSIS